MRMLEKEIPAGGVVHYAVKPSQKYQSLQREMLEAREQKKPTRAIEEQLYQLFCDHFSIPTKKIHLDFEDFQPAGGWNLEDGGITDHYHCHQVLGSFEIIVTHPYGWKEMTAETYRNAILKYELLCIIEANAWDYYYPQHSGCYILVRFKNRSLRKRILAEHLEEVGS